MSFRVDWQPGADQALRNIPWRDAAWISSEVNRLATDGVGDVRPEVQPDGSRLLVLFLPGYRVRLRFDRRERVLYVWHVSRSSRPPP